MQLKERTDLLSRCEKFSRSNIQTNDIYYAYYHILLLFYYHKKKQDLIIDHEEYLRVISRVKSLKLIATILMQIKEIKKLELEIKLKLK